MQKIIIDPESRSLGQGFAIVRAPRKKRARFPEGCVTPAADESEALAGADPERHLYPAEVYGPSVSSEGQRVFYLVRWLD
jgi:hypothetical protein